VDNRFLVDQLGNQAKSIFSSTSETWYSLDILTCRKLLECAQCLRNCLS